MTDAAVQLVAYHGHGFSHMVVSGVVHGVIYGVIYKLMRDMSLPEAGLLAGVVLAAVYAGFRYMKHKSGRPERRRRHD